MAAPNLQDVIASALTTALCDYLLDSEDETRNRKTATGSHI